MASGTRRYLIAMVCLLLPVRSLSAQYGNIPVEPEISFEAAVDGASRYVWRGLDLSNDVNIQPSLRVSNGLLEVGTWGSHALDGGYHEQDFWLAYHLARGPGGNMVLTMTDYYANPDFGADFFNFKGAGACADGEVGFGRLPRCAHGAHTVEMALSYSGESSPFDLRAAYNFHNDPEDAVYLEGRFRPVVAGFELGLTAGGVVARSEWYYKTDKAAIINLVASIGRRISIGHVSMPLIAEAIHNPDVGDSYFVIRGGLAVQ